MESLKEKTGRHAGTEEEKPLMRRFRNTSRRPRASVHLHIDDFVDNGSLRTSLHKSW
jgi:hypothetical protein